MKIRTIGLYHYVKEIHQVIIRKWLLSTNVLNSPRTLHNIPTFSVDPLGPIRRCRRLTNLSLFLTREPIFTMSHETLSSMTLIA